MKQSLAATSMDSTPSISFLCTSRHNSSMLNIHLSLHPTSFLSTCSTNLSVILHEFWSHAAFRVAQEEAQQFFISVCSIPHTQHNICVELKQEQAQLKTHYV